MRPQRDEERSRRDLALERARAGTPAGFDELVRWLEGPLLGFARARRSDDPHGVVNEVLFRAFRSLDTFSGDAADFRAWVYAIARNLIVDQTRARTRRVVELATAPTDLPPVAAADPVDAVDAVDGASTMAAALETLTPDQREVVVLRVISDLSVEDTARITGRTAGSVRVIQHRALARLRKDFSFDL